jgi:hypothetical protein
MMSKTKPAMFLTLLVLGLVFLPSISVQVQAQASKPLVRIDPTQTEPLLVDDKFTVYVWVDNAVGVEGAQVQVTYDPTVLNVTQVVEGPFLPSFGGTAVAQAYAEENLAGVPPTGKVFYSSAIIGGAGALNGASGNGILLNITFRVTSEGSSEVHLVPYFFDYGRKQDGVFFQNINWEPVLTDLKDGYYGTPVTLSARPDVINVGENVTLSGHVSGSASASVASVDIAYVQSGGNWTLLASVPTNGSGFFTYQWTGNEIADYQFQVSFVLAGKNISSMITVVSVEDVSSHFEYIYYALTVLILIIAAAVIVYIVRKRRRPEETIPLA